MKFNIDSIVKETNSILESIRRSFNPLKETIEIAEGKGAEAIFDEIKVKMPKVTEGENNTLIASVYTEAGIVSALKALGYAYKKPMGYSLHFFNHATSISIYLNQKTKVISLVP